MSQQHAEQSRSTAAAAAASGDERRRNGGRLSFIPNNVVAGYVAGISGTLVGHPMDSLKVWMQTNRTMANQQQLFSSKSTTAQTSSTAPTTAVTPTASSASSSRGLSASASTCPQTTTPRLSVEKMPAISASSSSSSTAARAMSTLAMPSMSQRTQVLHSRLRALYAGITGPLMAVGLVQSINFGVYDTTRRVLYYGWNDTVIISSNNSNIIQTEYLQHDSLTNVAISSMVAGSVLAFFTSPMMIIKTKQQLQGMSFRQAAREVLLGHHGASSQHGLVSSIFQRTSSSMYTGFAPHLFCETIGRCVYMCTYEALKRHLTARHQSGGDHEQQGGDNSSLSNHKISLSTRMVSAACAGTLGWVSVYPMDVIRNRFYAQTNNVPVEQRQNMRQLIQTIYQERGGSLRGFYRGFGVTIIRAGPVAAAVLPIYDITLETLNDGHHL